MSGIAPITDQSSDDAVISYEAVINGFEQLRAVIPTTKAEIIQLEGGRMQGRLKHVTVAELSLGFSIFSRSILSRGVFSDDRVTIGLVFDRGSRSQFSSIKTARVSSPGMERERRYAMGVTSCGGISVSVEDFADFFGPNNRFGEPSVLRENNSFRADHETSSAAAHALRTIMSNLDKGFRLSEAEAVFWKRAILEAVASVMMIPEPLDTFIASPRRLVRKAQEYIDRSGSSLVHISELISYLRVSRRTLHRAFDEVLGIPPITYLRYRRLCEARILLKEGAERDITVADVAFKKGFSDFGRFSGYYRSLFGENPSESLRSARAKTL